MVFPSWDSFMYLKHHPWDSHWVTPGTSRYRKSALKHAESVKIILAPSHHLYCADACDLCSVLCACLLF